MYEKELEVALKLARRAGTIALRYYRRKSRVQLKANRTFVTAADRNIEQVLIEGIVRTFPKDGLIAEESGHRHGRSGRFWTIDPIDGTRPFIEKTGQFCVMIGLVNDGQPVLGVIHAPLSGKTYWGIRQQGSFVQSGRRSRRLSVRLVDRLKAAVQVAIVVKPRASALGQEIQQALKTKQLNVIGSFGLLICALSEENADVFTGTATRPSVWDAVPGQVILEEAGGLLTDLTGKTIRYRWGEWEFKRGMIATTPTLIKETVRRMKVIEAMKKLQHYRRVLNAPAQKVR